MDWMKMAEGLMSNPLVINKALGIKPTPAPAPAAYAPAASVPVVSVANPVQMGMSTSKMLMIGGGVFASLLVLVMVLKKK